MARREVHRRLARLTATAVASILFPVAVALAAAQEPTEPTTLVVTVHDPSGAAIPNARVWLYPRPDREPTATRDGRLFFAAKPGDHDLFVEAPGFREVAKRIEVRADAPTAINLTLEIGGCTECVEVAALPPDSDVVLTVSDEADHRELTLRTADLKSLNHQSVAVDEPGAQTRESYSGFSLAGVIDKLCAAGNCDLRKPRVYIVVTGYDGYLVLPLAGLGDAARAQIVVADAASGKALPHSGLRVFLIEEGHVTESVHGIIGIRLAAPQR